MREQTVCSCEFANAAVCACSRIKSKESAHLVTPMEQRAECTLHTSAARPYRRHSQAAHSQSASSQEVKATIDRNLR